MHVNFVLRKFKICLLLIFSMVFFVAFTSRLILTLSNDATTEQWMDTTRSLLQVRRLQNLTKPMGVIKTTSDTCKPVHNIVFLKTHKTAGTTFMNILYRYGEPKNLTFVFMKGDSDLGFPNHFRSDKIPKLVNGKQYNILCRHARFNKTSMQELMPKDSFYITILREPVSHLQSRFDFYNMATFFRLESFLDPFRFFIDHLDDPTIRKVLESDYIFRNPLLFELGMTSKDILNETLVNNTILQLDQDFDFVILTEYFDESLVLLKDVLHWNLTDLLYIKMWVHKTERHPLTLEQIQKIEQLNRMDLLLYNYFNQSLCRKLKKQDSKFWDEVKKLKQMNTEIKEKCLDPHRNETHTSHIASKDVFYHHVNKDAKDKSLCNRMAADPWSYTSYLMRKQMKLLAKQDLRWGFIPYDWRKLDIWDPHKGYKHTMKSKKRKGRTSIDQPDRILSILCGMNTKCKNGVMELVKTRP